MGPKTLYPFGSPLEPSSRRRVDNRRVFPMDAPREIVAPSGVSAINSRDYA